jgi:leucyl-tRNA---protein transferase
VTISPHAARFYYSAPSPCPYLPGKVERRIFADLSGPQAALSYDVLSEAGFRRSLGFAYRPACPGCNACVPVRIPVADFEMRAHWKRIERTNADLGVALRPPHATEEQFRLFAEYQNRRHGDGEMARMDFGDYRTMVEVGSIDSKLVEARDATGRLIAACLVDYLARGFSAVYSFYDPALPQRSLGSFLILWLIGEARRTGLDHVYLGFWIDQSRKMAYKARFRPLEGLTADGWRRLGD